MAQFPVQKMETGYYFLFLMDYYYIYKNLFFFPSLPTKESSGVAKFLYSLICRHGVPKKVQTDQGREFVNSLNGHLFKLTGIKHVISLAYHPQTNGLIERFNQTLQRSLLKMVEQNVDEWDNYLDSVLFAYRTSKQASTKFSPFVLLYGREPRLPVDLLTEENNVCDKKFTTLSSNNLIFFIQEKGNKSGHDNSDNITVDDEV